MYVCGYPIDDLVLGKPCIKSCIHVDHIPMRMDNGPTLNVVLGMILGGSPCVTIMSSCRQTDHHPSQDHHHATVILLAESLSLIHYNILQSHMLIVLENPEINQNSYHQQICHDIFLCTLKDTKYKLNTTETPNRRISTPPPFLVPQVFPSLDTSALQPAREWLSRLSTTWDC